MMVPVPFAADSTRTCVGVPATTTVRVPDATVLRPLTTAPMTAVPVSLPVNVALFRSALGTRSAGTTPPVELTNVQDSAAMFRTKLS